MEVLWIISIINKFDPNVLRIEKKLLVRFSKKYYINKKIPYKIATWSYSNYWSGLVEAKTPNRISNMDKSGILTVPNKTPKASSQN